jgi:hypothetical protein
VGSFRKLLAACRQSATVLTNNCLLQADGRHQSFPTAGFAEMAFFNASCMQTVNGGQPTELGLFGRVGFISASWIQQCFQPASQLMTGEEISNRLVCIIFLGWSEDARPSSWRSSQYFFVGLTFACALCLHPPIPLPPPLHLACRILGAAGGMHASLSSSSFLPFLESAVGRSGRGEGSPTATSIG